MHFDTSFPTELEWKMKFWNEEPECSQPLEFPSSWDCLYDWPWNDLSSNYSHFLCDKITVWAICDIVKLLYGDYSGKYGTRSIKKVLLVVVFNPANQSNPHWRLCVLGSYLLFETSFGDSLSGFLTVRDLMKSLCQFDLMNMLQLFFESTLLYKLQRFAMNLDGCANVCKIPRHLPPSSEQL